ncbi:tetratricopeptide repeat protein [Pantoea dispersa]|uniref:tetratricopeptide repeat protein n=1 Tax=Pantoea dispersa TaxID=59814 RepID=UPI0024AF24F7|nr:tetratricopeptide repeat protein [Pantoea dispersa]MDI6636472.1 NB-ARC domain-containing protein [Pantoea dispersa]
MAFNLTRMTVYALISSLEEDLRAVIKDYLIGSENSAVIPDELFRRAQSRLEKDMGFTFDSTSQSDLIDYFDLGDTYQVINTNSTLIPNHIYKIIKANTKNFDKIVPIRNRVMHIRPLDVEDSPNTFSLCESLAENDITIWKNISSTLTLIHENPAYVLGLEIKNLEDSYENHNLPIPDFDETGLIGRNDDVKKIKQLCYGAFPVISIVGEGGVGKTALALKVAYEILEDNKKPFDAVVWVSSKTTQITIHEIKEIKDSISTSVGVIQEISNQVIGLPSSQIGFEEIIEYLSTFKIALFIDNLETILDENIKNFVGSLPMGSKIIITSRIGLGAYEYPVKLQGIDESYASQLLRVLAKIRGVETLATLEEKTLRAYVNRMYCNPSYIKWFVSSVQTGLSPESVLQNSNMFLEFCMSNVYQYLSLNARNLTSAMQCAPGLRDVPELSYMTDFDSLTINKALQELMSTNMLSQSSKAKGASIKNTYQLSELARSYLGKHHKPSQTYQKSIQDKRNQLNSLYEKQIRQRTDDKYNVFNIQFRDKSDRVVVKMLRDAQDCMREAQHDKAFELLNEAHKLAPDYYEVARVLAYFHQKLGNISDAREQYELAIVLAPNVSQLYFWFGRFLLRDEMNTDDAVIAFEKAYKLDCNSLDVALALARAYMFQHHFDKASAILNSVASYYDTASDQNQKVFLDTEIQIFYRLADDHAQRNEYSLCIFNLEAMRRKFDALPEKFKDNYIRQKLSKCNFILKSISKCADNDVNYRANIFQQWVELESR